MGFYFNPPQSLPEQGRRIEGRDYASLVAQLGPDELLFGHYDRGRFQNAPHLFSPREFEEFEGQARSGIIRRSGFYAVSVARLEQLYGHPWPQKQEGRIEAA